MVNLEKTLKDIILVLPGGNILDTYLTLRKDKGFTKLEKATFYSISALFDTIKFGIYAYAIFDKGIKI